MILFHLIVVALLVVSLGAQVSINRDERQKAKRTLSPEQRKDFLDRCAVVSVALKEMTGELPPDHELEKLVSRWTI